MKPESKSSDPMDCHVGRRIWLRRREVGLSRRELGDRIGVGLKQVNKYELGINRVSAGRLYEIGRALRVPAAYFFDEGATGNPDFSDKSENPEGLDNYPEMQTLLGVYHALPRDVRSRFLRLVRSIAEAEDG